MSIIRINQPLWAVTNKDYTFVVAPLSADLPPEGDQETIARRHFDLPVWNIKYLGHSFEGWQQAPLADDNDVAVTRTWDANPETRYARPLFDFTWAFNLTPADVEDPVLGDETQATAVPWGLDKNAYDGFQLAPLSEDFTEVSVSREQLDIPPWARDRHNYDGFMAAPLSGDFVADDPLLGVTTELAPYTRDRHSYDGWQAAPLVPELVIEEPLHGGVELSLTQYPPPLDMGFMGFFDSPRSDDFVAPTEFAVYRPTIRVRRR